MSLRRTLVHLSRLGIVVLAGFIAIGCVIEDPKAIKDIAKARSALDAAKKEGKEKTFPDKMSELEKRYLQARGVFYACQDAQASQLAESIIKDLAGLVERPMVAPIANRPPVARVTGPATCRTDEALAFDASGSSDPDGDALTYTWDFGDGTPAAKFTFPRTTHRYARAGNYTVRVTVDDGRGGTASASTGVTISQVVVLTGKGQVLFDYDKAVLKPAGIQALAPVVKELREQPSLRASIVGHTDSDGSDAYNLGLSKRRAESVRNYLVAQGIAASRLTTDWKGEREPVAPNTTAEGKAQNRRVVITLSPGN
jgi:outer membrane protein OmpA-like peptidoglycan-associated protein